MTSAGIEPNTETFEFLVLALIRLKRYEDAEIAYQTMQERKVEPSRDILFHMMKMYLILKDETRALSMVSLIKERQFGIDIPMINALLTYYYTTKHAAGIEQTLALMKSENVQPNLITLNLLMLIHNQQNNYDELQRVYQQFEQLGFYPDDVTLNVLAESRAKTGDGTYHISVWLIQGPYLTLPPLLRSQGHQ
jgi:tetratricopeptide (TPR) repeat protein